MNVGSLFSGIGGIDLGLERAGLRIAWQCESDPFCQRVLARHWPGLPLVLDVDLLEFAYTAGVIGRVDVLAGGFPCQPVSVAGRRRGQADARWLWPAFRRAVRLLRPRYVVVENVPGLLRRGMGAVLGDLAEDGFDAEWLVLSARDVGAPHIRERVWIIAWQGSPGAGRPGQPLADTQELAQRPRLRPGLEAAERRGRPGHGGGSLALANADGLHARPEHDAAPDAVGAGAGGHAGRRQSASTRLEWEPEPALGRVADGVPDRVDRLRALGNAVVPQCAEAVGRWLCAFDEGR